MKLSPIWQYGDLNMRSGLCQWGLRPASAKSIFFPLDIHIKICNYETCLPRYKASSLIDVKNLNHCYVVHIYNMNVKSIKWRTWLL